MTHTRSNETLARRYHNVLKESGIEAIYSSPSDLSGVFLASLPADFDQADFRVIVVGQEPKSWHSKCSIQSGGAATLESVEASMKAHQDYFADVEEHEALFLRFLADGQAKVQTALPDRSVSFVWANLLCVSDSRKSPVKSAHFARIQAISGDLLKALIAEVDPHAILFTTGPRYDKYLHAIFSEWSAGHAEEPHRLAKFRFGEAVCLRTCHPRYVKDNVWRAKALQIITEHAGTPTCAGSAAGNG